jgi:glycosyltransferase involved in cell wall biosynthesis
MRLSVIVPFYQGHKYIVDLIKMTEVCTERLNDQSTVELILSNDCPKEKIAKINTSDNIDVVVVNTNINRGIHGARVEGLSYCTGDYVVFLDQDDKISPDYFRSQIAALADADAVVCRARENGQEVYNRTVPFTKTIDYENVVSIGNTIVSPGQVLMRKEAVSDIWKRNLLKNNGVDDWFLWICMMQEGCRFVLNEDILFEHRIEGNNFSWNSRKMLLSEKEMLEIIKTESILNSVMLEKLENLIASEQQRYISILEKYRKLFFLYDRWMYLECSLGSISDYLYSQNIRKVVVYGLGYIGRQLVNRLKDTDVSLVGIIDRNAGFINSDIKVVRLEEFEQETDLVIITVLDNTDTILQAVRGQTDALAITMNQLLESWKQGGGIQDE